jgi:hypothetical protein
MITSVNYGVPARAAILQSVVGLRAGAHLIGEDYKGILAVDGWAHRINGLL